MIMRCDVANTLKISQWEWGKVTGFPSHEMG